MRRALVRVLGPLVRWWRGRSLAGQLVLTNVVVFALWALTTRQIVTHQASRRASTERTAERATAATFVASQLSRAMLSAEIGERGFTLTGDSAFLAPYALGTAQLDALVDTLAAITRDDATASPAAERFSARLKGWQGAADARIAAQRSGSPDAPGRRAELVSLMDSARAARIELEHVLQERAALSAVDAAAQIELDGRESLLLRLLLLAMIVLGTVMSLRRVTGTLDAIVYDARALAAGAHGVTLRSRSAGSRELGQLGEAFGTLAKAVAAREHGLRDDIRQLREVERLKTEFVSTVSHELRTPLTAVRGALGLVLAGTTGPVVPKTRELLQIALQNTERLIRLINDILDVERIEGGHLVVRREPCDLTEILRTTVTSLRTVAMESHVQLALEGEETAVVTGDPDRLVQVFTNLISNAVRYSPAGETVTITLRTTPTSAVVFVSDRGPGIPLEFRHRIFGKFQQADPGASPGGAGLGLAIVRAIIERHGGSVRFDSAPGHGTTFITELPYTPLVAAAARGDGVGHRLLIVDDDRDMLSVLRSLCAPLGHVTAVGSADEARRAAAATPYDAIVIDPGSPDSAGITLIRRLRELPAFADVPVLVFSAREFAEGDLGGVTLAPSHVFVKSRDREQDLLLRLRAVLAVRRPRRALAASA